MKIDPIIVKRFKELISMGAGVMHTRQKDEHGWISVNASRSEQWCTSCLSFLGRVLEKTSEHYLRFAEHAKEPETFGPMEKAYAVLQAALEDYSSGYLFKTSKLIQAEIFDDFLEQAEHFLKEGYFQVSAVITGAVLEDSLRKLCQHHSIPLADKPKLDTMNADLAKANVYDKLWQKRITLLADIRNKAAHGKWTEFSKEDSAGMLTDTRRFASNFIS